jgi:adenine-specific DNA-methyltransferase
MAKRKKTPKAIENITHEDATRKNIPTVEFETMLAKEDPLEIAYERRNPDLDPQLVWRGKDMENWSDLMVSVPPLYIQEKIHPKVLVDDLRRLTEATEQEGVAQQFDMFSDFNGLPSEAAKTEFYEHDANWSNRMILGDSLQVMASLAEREGLRGKVQMIYLDPPYGIKFNSNFQWSTTSKDVKDGKSDHITREPEQVKAFRDTWRDGIHSYLTYLRDRLIVARDLLTDSGSIFVQIGDENMHRVRVLLDEIFGDENFFSQITLKKLSPLGTGGMANVTDYVLWYAKSKDKIKFRPIFDEKPIGKVSRYDYVELPAGERRKLTKDELKNIDSLHNDWRIYGPQGMLSSGYTATCMFDFDFQGTKIIKNKKSWRTNFQGIQTLLKANRLVLHGTLPYYVAYHADNPLSTMNNIWTDSGSASTSYEKIYVVQTATRQLQKCILMATDPGDLVLDPTSGSGTTAYVAEQWGRRWIAIDTSRVALALARGRIMGARYPYYLLKDSREGMQKEADISHTIPSKETTYGNIRQGFVYERVPHIMLKNIANNTEIDVIWETFQEKLVPLREGLNAAVGKQWEEWQIPREAKSDWSAEAVAWHKKWWKLRIERQKEIDASIAAKTDYEYLYDKPYTDNKKVRVAGPFTVESLSPHRILGVDEDDELIDLVAEGKAGYGKGQNFAQMILENLKAAGVQQAHKEDKLNFASLSPWPGHYIGAEGRYYEGDNENGAQKRAGIFIGPEFGTVSRPDLIAAAREAAESDFDVLIACAFNYDARSTSFDSLGRVPILKARINADLHMADDLKNTGKGNLFVIFGEPDIEILPAEEGQIKVKIKGIDVFHPSTGEVRSDGAEGIALWFVDTDYNEESFFVRQAYFLGADDPYKALKTTLKAEINRDAWETLYSDTSRPFDKPASGRIAVKAINHLGDEVMKVFRVK